MTDEAFSGSHAYDDLAPVLAAFGLTAQPAGVQCLGGAGGFSGATLWRITPNACPSAETLHGASGDLCLRRWPPEQSDVRRLDWIHRVLRFAQANGFDRLPQPRLATSGKSWVERHAALWEMTPWLPGYADFSSRPSRARLRRATETLARFHRAVERFEPPVVAASPAILHRREQLESLRQGGIAELAGTLAQPQIAEAYREFRPLCRRLMELFPLAAEPICLALANAATRTVPLQPCIRDVWHDHVLWLGDEVSGLVDFGSMRRDCVATDVARLLGSLVEDDAAAWVEGLAAYEAIRPLGENERRLIPVLDQSGVLLGGMNWVDWLFRQGRRFDDLSGVGRRIEDLARRAERLASRGAVQW